MPVITIRGQFGSGAPEIGKLVAAKLHLDYIDREIIAEVAHRLRRPKESIEQKEVPPSSFWAKIADVLGHSSTPATGYSNVYLPVWEIPVEDSTYLVGLESVIKELAVSQSIVIQGRGSQFILKDYPSATHILVMAPFELRLKRIMESMKVNEEVAKKEIERFDSSHREFAKRYFKTELENPLHYDIVINTKNTNFEMASLIIAEAINLKITHRVN